MFFRCSILGIPSATERRLVPGVGKFEWSSFEDLQTIPGRPLAAAVPRLGPQGLDVLAVRVISACKILSI